MTHQREHADFSGLRVAVTGGTSGLGLELVRTLVRSGARVAFVARGRERVEQVARAHPGTHGIVGDVASKDDIYPIALQILGTLGGLDVLVNNASDLGPVPLALLGDTECEDLERALATNVLGPFRLTKALLGALSASARAGSALIRTTVCPGTLGISSMAFTSMSDFSRASGLGMVARTRTARVSFATSDAT
jgi:NAD(P)-dependent dehydrogenase (short-subunit alcohol dehydrogenase family)